MAVYEFVTVDVFTDRRFGGNPLAVFPDARGLTSEQMQALAMEFNLSETTFVLPPDNPQHHAKVRIFTPRAELPFAGHPNVGTGYVLAQRDENPPEHYVFEELAGLVRVHVLRSGAAVTGTRISAPRALSIDIGIPEGVVRGIDGGRYRHGCAHAAGRVSGHAIRHRRGCRRGGAVACQPEHWRIP
jgi:trans-2,3-dihydro-3-hydroxyanthranilate isomerase